MKELSSPPTYPVPWTFRTLSEGRMSDFVVKEGISIVRETQQYRFVTVSAQTWFAARAMAAVLLGVGPEDVTIVLPVGGPEQ